MWLWLEETVAVSAVAAFGWPAAGDDKVGGGRARAVACVGRKADTGGATAGLRDSRRAFLLGFCRAFTQRM